MQKLFNSFFVVLSCMLMASCGNSKSSPGMTDDTSDRTNATSCAGAPPPGQTIYGAWNAQLVWTDAHGHQVPVDETLAIYESGEATLTRTCHFSATQLTAQVRVRINVTGDEISYNESLSNVASDGEERCAASIQSERLRYQLVGNCVRFSSGKPSVLVKN
jgi:hypothetical protein